MNKIPRKFSGLSFLFTGFVFLALAATSVVGAEEAEEEDAPICPAVAIEKEDQQAWEQVEGNNFGRIQNLLKAGGYLTDEADGKPGPQTGHALARLCRYLEAEKIIKDPKAAIEVAGMAAKDVADKVEAANAVRKAAEDADDTTKAAAPKAASDANKAVEAAKVAAAAAARAAADVALMTQLAEWLEGDAVKEVQLKELSISVGDCGCSRDFSALSYGFLPYWLAGGEERSVDFSLLDRVGFHAIQLDEDGAISNPSLWSNRSDSETNIADFIRTAHKFRVEVDIVAHMAQWMNEQMPAATAAASIATAIDQQFPNEITDPSVGAAMIRLLRKSLPGIRDTSSVRADGINLYFDNYHAPSDAKKLSEIVEALHNKLAEQDSATRLNIILGLNWAGIKKTDGAKEELRGIKPELFLHLAQNSDGDVNTESDSVVSRVDNIFVFLPQNSESDAKITSKSKKLLRRVIEEAFDGHGAARKTVLRKTVPVITTLPDIVSKDFFDEGGQFAEDLIYLQDNFAGVGLWPLPMLPQEGDAPDTAKAIGERLIEIYGSADGPGLLGPEVDLLFQSLCDFACPNRWLFRLAFDVMVALLLIYWLLALVNCRLREFYQQKPQYFYAYGFVTVTIFSISLICDPFWKAIANYVLIAILLLLIVLISIRYTSKARKLP